jgi:hypothetical protein
MYDTVLPVIELGRPTVPKDRTTLENPAMVHWL